MRNWKKVLDFIATTKTKHQCEQHSPHTKSKTQHLLGGKWTLSQLSQPKSGHHLRYCNWRWHVHLP